MTLHRIDSDDQNDGRDRLFPLISAEVLRSAAAHQPRAAKNSDEKISLFWRIFGGTILSIVALVIITAGQMAFSSLHDLEKDMAHLKESKADLVRMDEYSATRTKIWERMQDMQKDVAGYTAPINQLKDRVAQIEDQCKTLSSDRKDSQELGATLKERLVQFEQQLAAIKASLKDIQAVQQTLSAMQEKMTLRDQQGIQHDAERKEMLKEIQTLRERVARIEATKEPSAVPAKPSNDGKASAAPNSAASAPQARLSHRP